LAILRFLFLSAKGATGREIAKSIGYSPQAVLQSLYIMEKLHLVFSKPIGKAKLYEANRRHWFLSEGLSPLWEQMDRWLEHAGKDYVEKLRIKPRAIIAFGSHVKGNAKAESDLDLLFLFEKPQDAKDMFDDILDLNSGIYEKYGVHPSPKAMSVSEFKKEVKRSEGLARNIFREGRSIAGLTVSEVIHYGAKKD
jgi:predicted nucleotidyltransferase